MDGRLGQCAKDCSSFLEGKEELGAENALFNVGLSTSCSRVDEVDMTARSAVSESLLCEGAAGHGGRRQAREKPFTDSMVGENVYRVEQEAADR